MAKLNIPTEILQLISAEEARYYGVLPKSKTDGLLEFYYKKGADAAWIKEELEIIYGTNIMLSELATEEIEEGISRFYRKAKSGGQAKTIGKSTDFLNNLINEADEIGSSDIHIEAYEDKCRVRMRIDGKLVERYIIPKSEYPVIINKIKIQANLDIAEKRLPQDGRILIKTHESSLDLRVSVLPSLHGEKIVLRLLKKEGTQLDIAKLGFNEQQLNEYSSSIRKTQGIILISGPTGSGKTTTLYSTLKILNQPEVNILTIEDPIEYTFEGINQVQLKEDIGLTFASALRTFLRQDPDVIMLGEIRDEETAQMAIRAALTGHLVLSTIHTNSAIGTMTRLLDMGIPGYLLANTLNISIAQRLVRLLCPHCKQKQLIDYEILPEGLALPNGTEHEYIPVGCDHCHYTGYKGRKAVYELVTVNEHVQETLRVGKINENEVVAVNKVKTLRDSAIYLYTSGETSLEEIYSLLIS